MGDHKGDKDALIAAVMDWWGDCESGPSDPADARLMQALWRYEGDHTETCPECDGECGEACAPITASAAIASLEHWIAEWNKRHGIVRVSP
jgi:hypothetical protein